MKSESKAKLTGNVHSNRLNATRVTEVPAQRKNAFGQIIISGCGRIEESYLFITKDLIIKSIKIKL